MRCWKGTRCLRPVAVGYASLAALQSIALGRYPHLFQSAGSTRAPSIDLPGNVLPTGTVRLAVGVRPQYIKTSPALYANHLGKSSALEVIHLPRSRFGVISCREIR